VAKRKAAGLLHVPYARAGSQFPCCRLESGALAGRGIILFPADAEHNVGRPLAFEHSQDTEHPADHLLARLECEVRLGRVMVVAERQSVGHPLTMRESIPCVMTGPSRRPLLRDLQEVPQSAPPGPIGRRSQPSRVYDERACTALISYASE
jgi:hypothetical protein